MLKKVESDGMSWCSSPIPPLLVFQHTLHLSSASAVMWEQFLVLIQKFEGDNDNDNYSMVQSHVPLYLLILPIHCTQLEPISC